MIFVRHNIEVAHRLYTLPGKCQQIHGHSMMVTLEVHTDLDINGYALTTEGVPLEFGELKKAFRNYLDTTWDHRLHLNKEDPLAGRLQVVDRDARGRYRNPEGLEGDEIYLPGLMMWPADPSTENIAKWIKTDMQHNDQLYGLSIHIRIEETRTNGAGA